MTKKQTISVAFSKITSFEEIEDASTEEKTIDAQECFCLNSANGHKPHWTEVYANFSTLESFDGFKEGLKALHVNGCENLRTAVGLPASCEEVYLDGSGLRALYIIDDLYHSVNMTSGLKTFSARGCSHLFTLRGISETCKTVLVDESAVASLQNLPNGVETISAKSCKNLKTTKGLPQSCKHLDLSFSAVETLEDIPETIEEIRLYNCYNLRREGLRQLPASVFDKIKGLSSSFDVDVLKKARHKTANEKTKTQNQKTRE